MMSRQQAAEAVARTKECLEALNNPAIYAVAKASIQLDLETIGDTLARELVCSVESLAHLLSKWNDHHYRPTIRGHSMSIERALADIYDYFASVQGLTMSHGKHGTVALTAYRG